MLRDRDVGEARVTPLELFFDLVFVFAITQLSHRLLEHLTFAGALETLFLLFAVWWAWIYTTWIANWFDPEKPPVRLMLMAVVLGRPGGAGGVPGGLGHARPRVAPACGAMPRGGTEYRCRPPETSLG